MRVHEDPFCIDHSSWICLRWFCILYHGISPSFTTIWVRICLGSLFPSASLRTSKSKSCVGKFIKRRSKMDLCSLHFAFFPKQIVPIWIFQQQTANALENRPFSPKFDGWNTIRLPIGVNGLFSGANWPLVSGYRVTYPTKTGKPENHHPQTHAQTGEDMLVLSLPTIHFC